MPFLIWVIIISWSVVFIDKASSTTVYTVAVIIGVIGIIRGTILGLRDTQARLENEKRR